MSRPLKLVAFDFGHTLIDERLQIETHGLRVMPGARDALTQITLPMALWANTREARAADVRRYLEQADLARFFSSIVTSVDAGARKPAARFFDYALAQARVTRDDVVFVGNQLNTDILGAEAFGIETIWLSDAAYRSVDDTPCDAKPTFTIATLADLPRLVEQLTRARRSPDRA